MALYGHYASAASSDHTFALHPRRRRNEFLKASLRGNLDRVIGNPNGGMLSGSLIGKWQGDRMSATFAAVRLKEESGASTDQATEAAKTLAATFVHLRKDKTFTAGMGGATAEGNWTFNKESGQVVLNVAKIKGPDQREVQGTPGSWTAYLDDDNRRLAFYPADPESVATIRQSKQKGGLSGGVSLYKR